MRTERDFFPLPLELCVLMFSWTLFVHVRRWKRCPHVSNTCSLKRCPHVSNTCSLKRCPHVSNTCSFMSARYALECTLYLFQGQKRPITVPKETYYSVKRDLLQCQKRLCSFMSARFALERLVCASSRALFALPLELCLLQFSVTLLRSARYELERLLCASCRTSSQAPLVKLPRL
jgi:hypothetical protein